MGHTRKKQKHNLKKEKNTQIIKKKVHVTLNVCVWISGCLCGCVGVFFLNVSCVFVFFDFF